jgi:hypothetical protein
MNNGQLVVHPVDDAALLGLSVRFLIDHSPEYKFQKCDGYYTDRNQSV